MNNLDEHIVIYGPCEIADFTAQVGAIEDFTSMVDLAHKMFGRDGLAILDNVLYERLKSYVQPAKFIH